MSDAFRDSQWEQWCGSNPVTIGIGQKIIIFEQKKEKKFHFVLWQRERKRARVNKETEWYGRDCWEVKMWNIAVRGYIFTHFRFQ